MVGFEVEGFIGWLCFCFFLVIIVNFILFLIEDWGIGRDILVFFYWRVILVFFESFSLNFLVILIFCGEDIFLVFFFIRDLWVFCLYWRDILVFVIFNV